VDGPCIQIQGDGTETGGVSEVGPPPSAAHPVRR